jgi:hypothetical protein
MPCLITKYLAFPGWFRTVLFFGNEAYQTSGQNAYNTRFRRREGRKLPGRPRSRWKENIILK